MALSQIWRRLTGRVHSYSGAERIDHPSGKLGFVPCGRAVQEVAQEKTGFPYQCQPFLQAAVGGGYCGRDTGDAGYTADAAEA